MTVKDVLVVLQLFEDAGIPVVVDGGWGVDALLARQTRRHDDLDIAVPHEHVPALRALLTSHGFTEVPRHDTRECNFVLGDKHGREIDIHSYTFDEQGNHVFGVEYQPDQLTGVGVIGGRMVRCIPAEHMVQFHTGYTVDENDYRDVMVLCEQFDLDIPDTYNDWQAWDADTKLAASTR